MPALRAHSSRGREKCALGRQFGSGQRRLSFSSLKRISFPQERDRLRMIAREARTLMLDAPVAPEWLRLDNHITQNLHYRSWKKWKSANLEKAIWRSQLSGLAVWG